MYVNREAMDLAMAKNTMNAEMLALKAGLNHQTIRNMRIGKSCKPRTVGLVAQALNIPVEKLISQERK